MDLANRCKELKTSYIKHMSVLAARFPGSFNLGQGVPSFATPTHITQAVVKELQENPDIGKYAIYKGLPRLRQLVAEKLEKETKAKVDWQKEIIITVGAMEGLMSVFEALVNDGDEVILPDPNYASHQNQLKLVGAKLKRVNLLEKDNWQLDIDQLKSLVSDKTKLLLLTNPGNPTGGVLSRECLEEIVGLAQKYGFYIVSDETYPFLVYDGVRFTSILEFRDKLPEQIVLVRSFSKEYAMTGWRLGSMVVPAKMQKTLLKVHDSLIGCPVTVSQVAGIAALEGDQGCVEVFVKKLAKRRELMCDLLDKNDFFEFVRPKGAYYIFAKYDHQLDSISLAVEMLAKFRVATVPGDAFGRSGAKHLRFSFAVEDEVIVKAMERVKEFCGKL